LENASKALIIAGGILIAILMISLILYARSSVSEYQNSKLELDRVENLAKFNEQFAQYDRKDVTGYEIISLANKVADYNYRYSNELAARNNEGYTPIKMEITFESVDKLKQLAYDGNYIYLFKKNNTPKIKYEQTTTENDIMNFITQNLNCESIYGGEEVLARIAKNINAIYLKSLDSDENKKLQQKKEAIKKFYDIVPEEIRKNNLKLDSEIYYVNATTGKKEINYENVKKAYDELNQDNRTPNQTIKYDVYKYYEYIQFKRCIFECTNMEYDKSSGRVTEFNFRFVKLR